MKEELLISRAAALFLLAMYLQLLFFQVGRVMDGGFPPNAAAT